MPVNYAFGSQAFSAIFTALGSVNTCEHWERSQAKIVNNQGIASPGYKCGFNAVGLLGFKKGLAFRKYAIRGNSTRNAKASHRASGAITFFPV